MVPTPVPNNNSNNNTATAPNITAVTVSPKKSKNPLAEFLRKNIKRDHHRHIAIPSAAAAAAAEATATAPTATGTTGNGPPQLIAATTATATTPSVSSIHSGSTRSGGGGGGGGGPFPSFVATVTPSRNSNNENNNNTTVTTTTTTAAAASPPPPISTAALLPPEGTSAVIFATVSTTTTTVVKNEDDDDGPPQQQQEEASEEKTNVAAAAAAAADVTTVSNKNEVNPNGARLSSSNEWKSNEKDNNNNNVHDSNFGLSMSNHSSNNSAIGLPLEDTTTPPRITATVAAALSIMTPPQPQDDSQTSSTSNAEKTLASGRNTQQPQQQTQHQQQPKQTQQQLQQQQTQHQLSLEERVTELELKLAVLSRLLQTQKAIISNTNSTRSSSALSSLPAVIMAPCPPTPPPPPCSTGDTATTAAAAFISRVQQHSATSSPHHTIIQRDNIIDHSSSYSAGIPHLESPAPHLHLLDISSHHENNDEHHDSFIITSQQELASHHHHDALPPLTTGLNHNKQGSILATDATSSLFVPPLIHNIHRDNEHDDDDDVAFQDSLSFSLQPQSLYNNNAGVSNTKRNLSFQLLYEKDDERAYQDYCRNKGKNIPPIIESMTPAERKWLGRDIQARLLQQRQEQEEYEEEAVQNEKEAVAAVAAKNNVQSQTTKQEQLLHPLQGSSSHGSSCESVPLQFPALKTQEDGEGKASLTATLETATTESAKTCATTTTVLPEKQQEAAPSAPSTTTTTTGATLGADTFLLSANNQESMLVVPAANAANNQETSTIVSSTYDPSTVVKTAAYADTTATTITQSAMSSLPSPQEAAAAAAITSSSSYKQSLVSSTASSPKKATSTATTASTSSSTALDTSNLHHHHDEDQVRHKWLNYLNSFQESTPDVDVQMEEFIQVPGHVENLMSFGYFICVDSFLYIITILPIRFVWSLMLLILKLVSTVFGSKKQKQASQQQQQGTHSNRSIAQQPSPFKFHRRHSYQIIQVFLLVTVYRFVLSPISIGVLYHYIRGQAMLKLYVLIAIVEVFDRLLCSLGQDCLDSLYWNTVNRPRSKRMIISVAVVLFYSTLHSLFLFVHVATMNVAMNSNDQALLTLFISGNFAEIKSTVFKKYNKPALFKLTVCDICERFKLGLFLALVLLLNLAQGMDRAQFVDYLRICGIVFGAEILADWIKHSFITKFNFLPSKVYTEYGLLLAGDVTGIGHEGFNLDNSYAVVKRIGFAQIPLVCVMFRLVREAIKYVIMAHGHDVSTVFCWSVAAAVWLTLLAAKLVIGSFLNKISVARLRAAPEVSASVTPRKKKKD